MMHHLKCLIAKLLLLLASNAVATWGNQAVNFIGVGYNILTSDFDYQHSGSLVDNQPILVPTSDQITSVEYSEKSSSEIASYVYEGTLSYQDKILEKVHLSGS